MEHREREWTPSQRRGIEKVDANVLVSAAAGSGKTSVLAERCAHLICDGPDRCAVDELLVVTFTEAAAAEMKGRIQSALAQRAARHPDDPHIVQQLALADAAEVGTLHGFCAGLLRQHFHRLGIDPAFVILDAHEAAMMKLDVAREMLGEWFDREDRSAAFAFLVDAYGDGDDERIVQLVLRLHDMLSSVVNPAGWSAQSLERLTEAAEQPLRQSAIGLEYVQLLQRDLQSLGLHCAEAGAVLAPQRNFAAYAQHLRELWNVISYWIRILQTAGLDALAEVSVVDLPAIPKLSTKLPGRDAAKKRVDAVMEEMKHGEWRQGVRFTQALWGEGIRQILPHATLLLELVEEFGQRYAATKSEAGELDFADLERLTLRALREEPTGGDAVVPSAVALAYQRQFSHVLVDEYQDINELQAMILSLVSRERNRPNRGGKNGPNLFCVGDVKQSIYRFRLADPSLFQDRHRQYSQAGSSGVVIDLQENFRSRSALLGAINGVFQRLMTADAADLDYDDTHLLRAGATFPDANGDACSFSGAPIELHLLPQSSAVVNAGEGEGAGADDVAADENLDRSQREARLIAERILTLVGRRGAPPMRVVDRADGVPITRPIRFGDIVILLRSMQYKADALVESLRKAGIAVHSETTTGYFEATEVNDVLALLAVLDNAAQDIPLAALLRSPLAMLDQAEDALARIRLAYPAEPFHAAVAAYVQKADDALGMQLRALWARLDGWRKLVRRRPLAEALWSIYDQSGYLAFCAGLAGGEQRQANLIELHERARQFGTFRRQGLPRFLEFLEKLKQDSDLGQASVASPAEDVVRVMSIHRSKGLEFPVVIVSDLGKRINFRDSEGAVLFDRCGGIGLQVVDMERRVRYPSLAWAVLRRRLRQQTVAEELRVLYVAMTRAKEHLILVGTCRNDQVEKWTATWSNHLGALPAATVLAARTPLDWFGPVAAAAGEAAIAVTMHTEGNGEPEAAASADEASDAAAERLRPLARLQALDPPPTVSPAAREAMDRLCRVYEYHELTGKAAAISVTNLAKPASARSSFTAAGDGSAGSVSPVDEILPQPTFFAGLRPLNAADRGTATHVVLQHLDFTKAADRSAIVMQVQRMLRDRRVTEQQAEAVDIEAIHWLLQQEVGRLLRERGNELMREVPVTFLQPPPVAAAGDPRDLAMVRGRIDVLVPTGGELVIVDYKTDRVEGEALEQRTEAYRGQLALYREAIERISRRKVSRAVLVFLQARQWRDV